MISRLDPEVVKKNRGLQKGKGSMVDRTHFSRWDDSSG
jgi:hypothetical protein